jgi:hypothetical protein
MRKCQICKGDAERDSCNECIRDAMSIGRKKKASITEAGASIEKLRRELFFWNGVMKNQKASDIIREYRASALEYKDP